MKKFLVFSLVLICGILGLGIHSAFAVPIAYNQTAISIPWNVQARNSTVTDLFTNNDTHLLNMQFENNLIDNSNYYNNSTWSGSSSFVTGKWGSFAANFTGSNYIITKSSSSFSFDFNSPFSVSAWFKTTDTTDSMALVTKHSGLGASPGWELWMWSGNQNSIGISFWNGVTVYCGVINAASSLRTGIWHHIVITYSGNGACSGVTEYVDDINLGSPSSTSMAGSMQNSLNVNIGNDQGFDPFKGQIDDVHIFNRVLSSSDINTDYNTGIYPTKPTLITNWYHYSGSSNIQQKFGTNTATLSLNCIPKQQSTFQVQGENILYNCQTTPAGTLKENTRSINTFSGSDSGLYTSSCTGTTTNLYGSVLFMTRIGPRTICLGSTTGVVTTVNGNSSSVYNNVNNTYTTVLQSNQMLGLNINTVGPTSILNNNNSTYSLNDGNSDISSGNGCVLDYIPTGHFVRIPDVACDTSIPFTQTKYYTGLSITQLGNYYTNSTLPFLSSIQDNQYKPYLTLAGNILGIPSTVSYNDFILYTPSANYMVVETPTNIYYANIITIQTILAKNYAYQTYLMSTQSQTSNYEVQNPYNETVRLYGPSNLNTTISEGGMFTLPSPYQIQAFSASTSNGQTRIIDPQWTNTPATNYPIIWTSTQLLYPIFLTVANAPTDAGLMVTNNNVVINSTQQTWAVLRLDSTHSGEYDVPAGTCQNVYIADISVKPAVYTYEGSTCATGVNQKTITYTNTLPLNFYTFTYGATHSYTPQNNQLTTTVRAGTAPFTYNVVVKNSTGAVAINSTFTSNSTLTSQNFNVSSVTKPASLYISAGGNTIYTAYLGSSLSLSSVASFFHQYFSYDGFDLLSFLPIIFASMWTRNTVGIGVVMVVVFIATLSWLSIVVVPDQYVYISIFIGILSMLGYRGLYGG